AASTLLFGAQLIGLFSRVSFIPMLGLPAVAELLEPGSWAQRVRRALTSGLIHGVLPGLLFVAINASLGTLHLQAVWEFAHDPSFVRSYTLTDFVVSLTVAGQGYAILAIALAPPGLLTHRTVRLHLAWLCLYVSFLGLGGGALWPRYFLPAVPSLL